MGKGRAPCCDKSQVKRGPWSPSEDLKLITFIQKHGHDNWRALPKQAGLMRCGKSCRLRWINYLRPDLKRGNFTKEEEETVIRLHEALGNKWSKIASHLPGRTDNEIKNVWNTHLKKKLPIRKSESSADESKVESSITSSFSSSSESFSSDETPNSATTTVGIEFHGQAASQVTMAQQIEQDSEKQLSNEVIGITEYPKDSSASLSSIESNSFSSSQVVAYKPESQMGSPFNFNCLGPCDVNNALQQVDKPKPLLEIPLESDYDFWKMLDDNLGSFHSNEEVKIGQTPNYGEKRAQGAETKEWFHDFENNEFGLGATTKDCSSKDDQFLPKNNSTVPEMDPSFGFDVMTRPESDLDLGYVQLWSSWPNNSDL